MIIVNLFALVRFMFLAILSLVEVIFFSKLFPYKQTNSNDVSSSVSNFFKQLLFNLIVINFVRSLNVSE